MKRLLITGSTGSIGTQCLKLVNTKEYDVHTISSKNTTDSLFESHTLDLLDLSKITTLIKKINPTDILHLAWTTEHGKYWSDLNNLSWIQSTIEILKAFNGKNANKIVISGTCAEYDWNYSVCQEDTTPCNPRTLYGISKHSLHSLVRAFSNETKINYAWGRLFFVYGEYENKARIIPYTINQLLKNKKPEFSNLSQARDFIHVYDAANILMKLLTNDINGVFNIGSGQKIELKDLVTLIAKKMSKLDLIDVRHETHNSHILVADMSKLNAILNNFNYKFNLNNGLEHTIDCWSSNNDK